MTDTTITEAIPRTTMPRAAQLPHPALIAQVFDLDHHAHVVFKHTGEPAAVRDLFSYPAKSWVLFGFYALDHDDVAECLLRGAWPEGAEDGEPHISRAAYERAWHHFNGALRIAQKAAVKELEAA